MVKTDCNADNSDEQYCTCYAKSTINQPCKYRLSKTGYKNKTMHAPQCIDMNIFGDCLKYKIF